MPSKTLEESERRIETCSLWVLVGVVRRSILRRHGLNFNSSTESHAPNHNIDQRAAYKYLIREIYKIRESTTVNNMVKFAEARDRDETTEPDNSDQELVHVWNRNVRNQGTDQGKYRLPSQRICDDAHLFETNLPESIIHRFMNEQNIQVRVCQRCCGRHAAVLHVPHEWITS
jgi:hypothetical protein